MKASCCPHCQGDVSEVPQRLCEAYDHVELPPVRPEVTRVMLFGGDCPHCHERFKAAPPAEMPSGSPFGANLRALVIYWRYTHGIAFGRLAGLLNDLYGLTISEGALTNMLNAAIEPFTAQTSRIRDRLLSSSVLESDETGMRVGKRNFWLWVIHHKDSAVFLADPTRAKRVLCDFLGDYTTRLLDLRSLWRAKGLCHQDTISSASPISSAMPSTPPMRATIVLRPN